VDAYYAQLGGMKTIFSHLKNAKTLWEKSTLIMDKDEMTDKQRRNIMDGFSNGALQLKTYIWESYHFESVLLSELETLAKLLRKFIHSKGKSAKVEALQAELTEIVEDLIRTELKNHYEDSKNLKSSTGKLNAHREMALNPSFGLKLKNVFETEIEMQLTLSHYCQSCLSVSEAHKICKKEHLNTILKKVLARYELNFELERDFDGLFVLMDKSTMFKQYEHLLTHYLTS
jgi:hypothetical protein